MTEGRQALSIKLAGIHGGIECAKLAPQLSALADGEASSQDLSALRAHLRTCLSCRATLKAFRAAPARVAALVPPAGLAGRDGGGTMRSLLESVVGAVQHKAAAVGERAHAAAELAAGQKVAAVAASAAALAGGGTAVDQFANHQGPPRHETQQEQQPQTDPVAQEAPTDPSPAPLPPPVEQLAADGSHPTGATPAPAQPRPEPPPPPPDPANEFTPAAGGANPQVGTSSAPASTASAGPVTPAPAPPAQPAPVSGGGGGPGEFAP